MKYRGRVRGGLVVLDQTSSLRDGTLVDVEPVASLPEVLATDAQPPRGSALAVLRHAGIWSAESQDVECALAELRASKQEELSAQINSDDGTAPE